MSAPSNNYYLGVKLTLRQISAPATTKTVYFMDRPNTKATADATPYWPILLSVSEFGCEMDEFLPKPYSGSFTIDDTVGTFGEGRKFSDVLERYTAIGQAVEIHLHNLTLESDEVVFSSSTDVWIARVGAVSFDFDGEQSRVTFSIDQDAIPDRQLCVNVSETVVGTATANRQAVGKWLPIAVGSYNYLPAADVNNTASTRTFAYATNLGGNAFKHGVTSVYSRDAEGEWSEITSALSSAYARGGGTSSYSLDPSSCAERIYQIKNASTQNGIITGVKFEMDPNGTGGRSSTCKVSVSVYELPSATGTPTWRRLATGEKNLSTYDTQNNAGTDFDLKIVLDRAVVLNATRVGYAIGVSSTGWAAGEASIYKCATDNCNVWQRNSVGNYELIGATEDAPAMACQFTTVAEGVFGNSDENGFYAATVTLSEATGDYVPLDTWDAIDLCVKTTGVCDDGSGSLTGTAGLQLTRPDHFIRLLAGTPPYMTLTPDWDWTTYASSYSALYQTGVENGRVLVGYQDAPLSLRDALITICRDSASRIGVGADGKLFLWPWGVKGTVQKVIGADDIQPIAWTLTTQDSIVNRVNLSYGVTNIEIADFRNQVQKKNFTGNLDRTVPTRGDAQILTTNSFGAYGKRQLEISEASYIGDASSAATMVDYYFIRYAQPLSLAEIEVPYHKYSTLKLLQIVEFAHPAFPKYSGAVSRHEEPPQDDSTVERAFLKAGHKWRGAKPYRGQIERWSVTKPEGGPPRLRLLLRVLPHYPIDPT